MMSRRSDRLDREAADRLLDRLTPPDDTGPDPLTRLLAVAAAAAQPGELAGEESALAAFRAARAGAPQPVPVGGSARARRAGAVAWVVGLATVATAGVAVAAGGLGGAGGAELPSPPVAPGGSTTTASTAPAAAASRPDPAVHRTPTADAGTPRPGQSDLQGLCTALLSRGRTANDREAAAHHRLVVAAGGPEKVEAYCRALVQNPSERSTVRPDRPRRTASATPARSGTQVTPGPR